MLTLETFETSSIEASLNCIFYLIFSLKLYRGMFSRILYKLPESNNNNSSSQLSAQLMSLIIIVIISALFWTVQKGSELYTTYFKVALLKCHTSCKLVVLLLCLQTTTTFCTFSLTLNFPNMKHLCFTQVIFDGEEEIEYCFISKVYSKSNHFCIHSVLIQRNILEIKSILHTYITIQSRLQSVGIFYLSEQLSDTIFVKLLDFFQQLNVKFFEKPKSDNELHIRKKVGSIRCYLTVLLLFDT